VICSDVSALFPSAALLASTKGHCEVYCYHCVRLPRIAKYSATSRPLLPTLYKTQIPLCINFLFIMACREQNGAYVVARNAQAHICCCVPEYSEDKLLCRGKIVWVTGWISGLQFPARLPTPISKCSGQCEHSHVAMRSPVALCNLEMCEDTWIINNIWKFLTMVH
jgi:hypothetical protein